MSQSNVSVLNADISSAIEAFARSRNVSVKACLEAAAIALVMQPFGAEDEDILTVPVPAPSAPTSTPAPAAKSKRVTNARPSREAGVKSTEFREKIIAKAPELRGKRHTFAEVGALFGIDAPNATNNLKWLLKNKKINYQVVGHATKAPGAKGRAPAIIEFV